MSTCFTTTICTLENMTPDHIRILDGKFLPPTDSAIKWKNPEDIIVNMDHVYKKMMMPIMIRRDGFEYLAKSQHEAAYFLGRKQPIISMALSRGYRVKSYVDGEWYSVSKYQGDNV